MSASRFAAVAVFAAVAGAALRTSGPVFAEGRPDPKALQKAQREAMAPLAFLDGQWRGEAWTMLPTGQKHGVVQTERVGPFLGGSVKVVEGRGYDPDGTVAFNAFGVISFDPAGKTYTLHSYAEGSVGDFPFTPHADGFTWEIAAGPMTMRFSGVVKDGKWHEVGERLVANREPVRFFQMDLERIGDTAWPAEGAVPSGIGTQGKVPPPEPIAAAKGGTLPDFDELWNYGDPAGTEAKFRALLPQAEAAGGEYLAQLWTQIARTYSLRAQFDKAHETLDRVDASLEPAWTTARVRSLLERGRTFNSSKKKDDARPLFLRAWEEAKAAHLDEYACDAAHMMGIVEPGEKGVEWTTKALAVAEVSKEPKAARWVGSLCQNLGYAAQERGEHETALAYFRRGLAWSLERRRAGQARIFKWFIGKSQRLTGDLDGALATQREVAKESEAAGAKDGFAAEEIAETLMAQGKPAEARPHFADAYALLKDDPELVDDPKRRERLRTLGGVADSR